MRARDIAYEQLRDDIIQWRLAPGAPLGEIETAERLGMSRTPVREALARLAAEGLVSTDAGRTVIVSRISATTVKQLFQYREALETQAARLAARLSDRSRFAELAAEFERGPDDGVAPDVEQPYFLARHLDEAIDASIDNPFLVAALRDLRGQLSRLRRNAHANPARLARATEEHLLIATAILAGDEVLAVSATVVHLRNSMQNILETTLASMDLQSPAAVANA